MTIPSPTPSGHPVHITSAGKDYGRTRALDDVSLQIDAGQFLVLLGPSGSGKTTLIRALAGIERLDRGTITIGTQLVDDTRRHTPPERRDLAMVFQDYALWPHLTAAGNVGYALRRRKLPPDQYRARVHEALDRVGLSDLTERYPQELSGGQQQRVALARAIVARPGLLLFDEPLSNLDTDLRERLRVEIATLTREAGSTAVYITHDQSEAFALADKIGVLDQGRLVQLADPETLYRNPATPFVARFTGLSGELPGHVLTTTTTSSSPSSASSSALIQSGPWRLHARTQAPLAPDDPVRVLIRTSAPSITPTPTPTASSLPIGQLDGTVVDVAYRGRGYDHVISCGPDILLAAVFAPTAHPRGTRVRLTLDPEGCIAYPDSTRYDMKLTTVSTAPRAVAEELGSTR